MTPTILILSTISLSILAWSYSDYRQWKALGKGGLPYNLIGWFMVTYTRLFKKDPLAIKHFEDDIGNNCDVEGLPSLPKRTGGRPSIAKHPVPHRQLSQVGNAAILKALQGKFDEVVEAKKDCLNYALSQYEKRNNAVWLSNPDAGNACTCAKGEIAHIHPIDGSMHMVLSPTDAKQVLEAGWGELHPLAGKFIPVKTYVLVYSPRNEADLGIIQTILKAAVKYARKEVVN